METMEASETAAPPPPPPVRRPIPGVLQSILWCVVVHLAMAAAALLVTRWRHLSGMPDGFAGRMLLSQVLVWAYLLLRAPAWARTPLRSAYPLRTFPVLIIPALVTLTLGIAILALAAANFIPMPEALEGTLVNAYEQGREGTFMLISVVLVAPIAEELFFRGLILRGYMGRYSPRVAIWASSLLFAVFHFNPWQAVIALPVGLLAAWVFLRTGSLLPCIIVHMAANATPEFVILPLCRILGLTPEETFALESYPLALIGIAFAMTLGAGSLLLHQLALRPGSGHSISQPEHRSED